MGYTTFLVANLLYPRVSSNLILVANLLYPLLSALPSSTVSLQLSTLTLYCTKGLTTN